ncbi:unnamed protein product, partial [Polarella glacialis]
SQNPKHAAPSRADVRDSCAEQAVVDASDIQAVFLDSEKPADDCLDPENEEGKKSFHSWSYDPGSLSAAKQHPLPSNGQRHKLHEDKLQQFLNRSAADPSKMVAKVKSRRKDDARLAQVFSQGPSPIITASLSA